MMMLLLIAVECGDAADLMGAIFITMGLLSVVSIGIVRLMKRR